MTEQQFSPSALQRGAVFRFGAPALAAAVFLGYAAAMLRDFEYDIGHFEPSSPAFYLCAVGCALAVLFAALQSALTYRRTVFTELPGAVNPPVLFASVLGACMCAVMAVQNLANTAEIAASTTAGGMPGIPPAKLYFWSSLCGLFLAAALILKLIPSARRHPGTVVCAVLGAFSVNIAMFAAYFSFEIPLNSPVRHFTTLTESSVLLFLLSEARLCIAKDAKKLPPAFQLFGSAVCGTIALGISGAGVVYRLIVLSSNPQPEPNLPLPRLVLYACLGIIALSRTFEYRKALRDMTPEEIREAKEKEQAEKDKKKNRRKEAEQEQNATEEPSSQEKRRSDG